MKPEELFDRFNSKYGGYVCIDIEIVLLYLSSVDDERLEDEDYLYDWVLANDLAYEVVE